MGDILGPAILVLFLIIGVGALVWFLGNSSQQRKSLSNAPALLLPNGEPPDVLLKNAQNMHRLAERSARILDRILNNPDAGYMLNEKDRKEAQEIVNAFYNH